MGVNTIAHFPHGIHVWDFARVAAALLGHPVEDRGYLHVAGFKIIPAEWSGGQASFDISLDCTTDNPVAKALQNVEGNSYLLSYYFEGRLGPHIRPASLAAKAALAAGLVDFFGGTVDIDDCDDIDYDIVVPAREDIYQDMEGHFESFHNRLRAIKPLTSEDMEEYQSKVAYK